MARISSPWWLPSKPGAARVFAPYPGQHGGNMAVLTIKGDTTLRVGPGKTRQAAFDGVDRHRAARRKGRGREGDARSAR